MLLARILAVATLALAPLAAGAQDRATPLLAMLDRVPAAMAGLFQSGLTYSDYVAGAAAMAKPPATMGDAFSGPFGGVARAIPGPVGQYMGDGTAWAGLVGFAPWEMRSSLHATEPPLRLWLIELAPAAAARVPATLLANGYEEEPRLAPLPAWRRGGEDFAPDLAARNPDDPFGGDLGLASRLSLDGTHLTWSTAWPALVAVAAAGAGQSLADNAELAALARALDAPEAGPGHLVQAVILPRGASLAPDGLAPWGAAIIADIPDGPTDRALLGLTYATRAQAEEAAALMLARWQEVPSSVAGQSFAQIRPTATVTTAVTGEGPFVAFLVIEMPLPEDAFIPRGWGAHLLLSAWMQRDMVFLPLPG